MYTITTAQTEKKINDLNIKSKFSMQNMSKQHKP